MFLGYARKSTGVTYCMLNIHTKCIALRREIIWQKKPTKSTYQEKKIPRQTPILYKTKMSHIIGIM